MNRKRRDGEKIAKYILGLPAGIEIDKLVTTLVFERKIGECSIASTGWHIQGADHYQSFVSGRDFCGYLVPGFSTKWEHCQGILEWLTAHYPSVQVFWDCDHWGININTNDETGNWFRLSSVSGVAGFQEALCKAALLSKVYPQELPLEIRFTAKIAEKKPKKRRKKRRST